MSQSKPQEFWITKSIPGAYHVKTKAPEYSTADFHVIEYSAYAQLMEAAEEMASALNEIMDLRDTGHDCRDVANNVVQKFEAFKKAGAK